MNNLTNKNILNNKRKRIPINNKDNFSSSSITNESTISAINIIKDYNKQLFKKNPNLKFQQDIITTNDIKGFNDLFEVYISIRDDNPYLISPNSITYNIDIILLNNNKLIRSLEGHKNNITTVRYFSNNLNEYLISADINSIVIIWDISNDNIEKYKLKLKYSNWIYSCLLFFNDYMYIFTSCCGIGNTKVYILDNNKINFLKNINNSKNNNTYYLLSWYNEKNKKYYIIEFCKNKIVITNIYNNKLYKNLIAENNKEFFYMNGFIYNSYLFACSTNGYINIWDIYEKKLINSILIYKCLLNNFIHWNEKYIILVDGNKNSMIIFDLSQSVVISNISSQHENGILCIKKIIHPTYGESLISSGQDGSIKLWSI